jgi:hypothetical protein
MRRAIHLKILGWSAGPVKITQHNCFVGWANIWDMGYRDFLDQPLRISMVERKLGF